MSRRVLIIGSGIIGLCSAYSLTHRGFEVTLIDRDGPEDQGCSFGNAGMVVPSHIIPLAAPGMVGAALRMMLQPGGPFYIRPRLSMDLLGWGWKFQKAANAAQVERAAPVLRDMHLASRALYEELADLPGSDIGLVKRGLLMLCKSVRVLEEEGHLAEKAASLGVPAQVLDAKQTAQLDPDVSMDVAGSVYFPKDCHLIPGKLVATLREILKKAGATFIWNTEVTGWKTSDNLIEAVLTSTGQHTADEYILAAGSWSPTVARDLRLKVPMQAGKGYSMTLSNPRQLPQLCSIFTEARVAVTPMGGSLRFGGTMEIAGINHDISQKRVDGIINSVPGYFPQFRPDDFRDLPVWHGLRPCSPDGLPYVGRTGAYKNLAIATGHAMMGISLGPVTGELIAQVLEKQKTSIDIRLLHPDRYAVRARRAQEGERYDALPLPQKN